MPPAAAGDGGDDGRRAFIARSDAAVTVNVAVPDPVTVAGLNDPVALGGNPLTDRLTDPENPPVAPIVTVYVVAPPGATDRVLGVAETVKSGTTVPFTTSVTDVMRVSAPLVPVIVMVELPTGVLAAVVMVRVELPAPVNEAGLKEAVALAGKPLAERLTEPSNPFSALTLTVKFVLLPCVIVRELGVLLNEKSGAGGGVSPPTGVFMSVPISAAVSARL